MRGQYTATDPTTGMAALREFDPQGIYGPLTADLFTTEDLSLLAQKGMLLKRGYRDQLFDRHRIASASALPTSRVQFFAVLIGAQTSVDNASATVYAKQDHDTNISAANQLPRGELFIVQSFQVLFQIASAIDNTVTLGEILDPTPKAASTPISPANFIRAFAWAGNFALRIGAAIYEQGPPIFFPSFYGFTGWAGTGTALNNESLAQNGFGRQRFCHPYHIIDEMRGFYSYVDWRDAFIPNNVFYLTVVLDGVHLTPAQ